MVERTEAGTRERIVAATAALLRRQGYDGTGVKQIAREADATLGSVYHFFPEGKEQLAAEALRRDAAHYTGLLRSGLASAADPAEGIAAFAHLLADDLKATDWLDCCLVAPTALEKVGRSPVIQRIWEESLSHWQKEISARLRHGGLPEDTATEAACTVLSTLQGAEVISRMASSETALRTAAEHLRRFVDMLRAETAGGDESTRARSGG